MEVSNLSSDPSIIGSWDSGVDRYMYVIYHLTWVTLQRGALGPTQGFVTSFPEISTGWLAIPQLLCSQAKNKFHKELLKINKQNLNVRPSVPLCISCHFTKDPSLDQNTSAVRGQACTQQQLKLLIFKEYLKARLI